MFFGIFLKANLLVQILIIAGLVILFLTVTLLNQKMKAKKGEDLPENCQACASTTCMIKLTDANKIKEELKEELRKCEKENNDE